ncbi:hypothetical protein SK128_012101, partial [Halocaridina rubra]
KGFYQFSDGSNLRGLQDKRVLPPDGQQCVTSRASDGLFGIVPCSSLNNVLCVAKQDDCPQGYLKRGSECFWFSQANGIGYSQAVSTDECRKLSGNLLWTKNLTTLQEGLSILGFEPQAPPIIPPSKFRIEGMWNISTELWSFNDSVKLSNYTSTGPELIDLWETGSPNPLLKCVVMLLNGRLASDNCEAAIPFICQANPGLVGTAFTKHNIPIVTPTCYEDDIINPQFLVNPAVYNPEELSMSSCRLKCYSIGHSYAAAKRGKQCFCSNIITLRPANWSLCDYPCSDTDSGESCGSPDGQYIVVLNTAGIVENVLIGMKLDYLPKAILYTNYSVTFNANSTTGAPVMFRMRYGEGGGYTASNELVGNITDANLSHIYYLPGTYTVTAMFFDQLDLAF